MCVCVCVCVCVRLWRWRWLNTSSKFSSSGMWETDCRREVDEWRPWDEWLNQNKDKKIRLSSLLVSEMCMVYYMVGVYSNSDAVAWHFQSDTGSIDNSVALTLCVCACVCARGQDVVNEDWTSFRSMTSESKPDLGYDDIGLVTYTEVYFRCQIGSSARFVWSWATTWVFRSENKLWSVEICDWIQLRTFSAPGRVYM